MCFDFFRVFEFGGIVLGLVRESVGVYLFVFVFLSYFYYF